jgi:hypothetical protein
LVVHCARKEKDRVINYAFLAISKNSGSLFLRKINSPGKKTYMCIITIVYKLPTT